VPLVGNAGGTSGGDTRTNCCRSNIRVSLTDMAGERLLVAQPGAASNPPSVTSSFMSTLYSGVSTSAVRSAKKRL
jgi:hypothetical protein